MASKVQRIVFGLIAAYLAVCWAGAVWKALGLRGEAYSVALAAPPSNPESKAESGRGKPVKLKGGYFVCMSKGDLKTMTNLAQDKDMVAGQKLIDSGRCGHTKAGAEVHVKSRSWGLVEIRAPGEFVSGGWTHQEAVGW